MRSPSKTTLPDSNTSWLVPLNATTHPPSMSVFMTGPPDASSVARCRRAPRPDGRHATLAREVDAMTIADRYELSLSTSSAVAAQHYQEGMDRQLSYGAGAEERFAAAADADAEFALPHAGLALLALFRGDGAAARAALGRARDLAGRATRREQQHVEALSTLVAGETARGLAQVQE